MSNDSEDVAALENRVKELEATVRGLTEELVDANERIRELEDYHDAHESAGRPESEPLAAGAPEGGAAERTATAETADGDADAADAADAEPEDTPAEGAEETDEESDFDDIIVA